MVDGGGSWHPDRAASLVDQVLHELVATVRAGASDTRVADVGRRVVDALERRHHPLPPPAEIEDALRGLRAVESRP